VPLKGATGLEIRGIYADCDFCGAKVELGFEDLSFESYPCGICGEHIKIYIFFKCKKCDKINYFYFRNDEEEIYGDKINK
jgi:hypothetical protein